MKTKIIKVLVTIGAIVIMVLTALFIFFTYETEYKQTEVMTDSYGGYEISILEIGEPDFPFGSAHCKAVLKDNGKKVCEYSFDVLNDGGHADKEQFIISWNDDNVTIISSGEEQPDMTYRLYYDGTVPDA